MGITAAAFVRHDVRDVPKMRYRAARRGSRAGCTSDDTRPPTPPPEVTSPAPKPVENGLHSECFVGMIRADRANPAEVIGLLGSHVPTWLPKGFGFFIGWKGTKSPGSSRSRPA